VSPPPDEEGTVAVAIFEALAAIPRFGMHKTFARDCQSGTGKILWQDYASTFTLAVLKIFWIFGILYSAKEWLCVYFMFATEQLLLSGSFLQLDRNTKA
jgi:hypothetical protein